MRRTLVALLVTAGALTAAAPASAGVMRTQNSCKVSFDQVWHHATVDLSGLASPNPAAPGSGTTLGQTSARVILPEYLTRVATDAMIFKAGENEIRCGANVANRRRAGAADGHLARVLPVAAARRANAESWTNLDSSASSPT